MYLEVLSNKVCIWYVFGGSKQLGMYLVCIWWFEAIRYVFGMYLVVLSN